MTRTQALKKLNETRQLSTKMLKPLGISFEAFLRFAQLPDARADAIMAQLIENLNKKYGKAS